jgi:hypothetical protein
MQIRLQVQAWQRVIGQDCMAHATTPALTYVLDLLFVTPQALIFLKDFEKRGL